MAGAAPQSGSPLADPPIRQSVSGRARETPPRRRESSGIPGAEAGRGEALLRFRPHSPKLGLDPLRAGPAVSSGRMGRFDERQRAAGRARSDGRAIPIARIRPFDRSKPSQEGRPQDPRGDAVALGRWARGFGDAAEPRRVAGEKRCREARSADGAQEG